MQFLSFEYMTAYIIISQLMHLPQYTYKYSLLHRIVKWGQPRWH